MHYIVRTKKADQITINPHENSYANSRYVDYIVLLLLNWNGCSLKLCGYYISCLSRSIMWRFIGYEFFLIHNPQGKFGDKQ
jgi:hypothetical protein